MTKQEYIRQWYVKNRRWILSECRRRRDEKARIVRAAKNRPCKDCRRRYPHYVMDFDHVRGRKRNTIAHLKCSVENLLKEIAKCDVVCSNCHRKRTFRRRGFD